jgi:hypothetical protein
METSKAYPVSLSVDYQDRKLDKLSSFFPAFCSHSNPYHPGLSYRCHIPVGRRRMELLLCCCRDSSYPYLINDSLPTEVSQVVV